MSKVSGIDVIGIAAPTCAGKTILVAELQKRIKSPAILSFDAYDLYPPGSETMDRELTEKRITNWEDPSLFDIELFVRDLGRIAQGDRVKLQNHSRESIDKSGEQQIIIPSSRNIVEGIFVLHDQRARALLDLSFFIDIPHEVMVERRLARSAGSAYPWDDPEYITGAMVEGTKKYVLPQREHAHVVLDGLRPIAELADIVIEEMNTL